MRALISLINYSELLYLWSYWSGGGVGRIVASIKTSVDAIAAAGCHQFVVCTHHHILS